MLHGSVFSNAPLIEEMLLKYRENPQSVDDSWKEFFEHLDSSTLHDQTSHLLDTSLLNAKDKIEEFPKVDRSAPASLRIYHLIDAYRTYGHLMAKVNPISTREIGEPWQLSLKTLHFSKEELNQPFPTCGLMDQKEAPLQEIIDTLKSIYCDKIGVEYMGLQNPQMERWLQSQIEPTRFKIHPSIDQKRLILQRLNMSELFEVFLNTKYTGQKRFSLEGGETLIPILAAVLEVGAELGIDELFIGMAHRGRLNVLANIMDKSYSTIFSEFEEGYIPVSFEGSGDVKYHKGFSSTVITTQGKKVKIGLSPNPSHLEATDPIVVGQAKATQVLRGKGSEKNVLPILIHGDAAIAGQGVVYETMQLYKLSNYSCGGTLHIVINNQIGFTTLPKDTRSTYYCTDIGKNFSAPVFHVNAEDPEGCVYAVILAVELRQKYHCDVIIDLCCYRKYGHNETDEPAFTQPLEYQIIRQKKPIRELYRDRLIQQGVLEKKLAEELENEFKNALQRELEEIKVLKEVKPDKDATKIRKNESKEIFAPVTTKVKKDLLKKIGTTFCTIPNDFNIHKKLKGLYAERMKMANGEKPIDWAMAELLAIATLLWEGRHVRFAGQDSSRGTFSQRHAILMDQKKERAYYPLKHLKDDQGLFDMINSPLTEYAGLGFEYGYSITAPDALVIWEAQFGDFCNGAQVIIDQYIATAEQKWGQKQAITMFLPHGYEGQGPEHSSGRMERFLALSAEVNMQIVNTTTPAQFFHLLRRQALRKIKKPLVVFTPKALLRHPACISTLDELVKGTFREILDDPTPAKKTKKLVICSGKIYYELNLARQNTQTKDMTIIRIEQLYPLNETLLKEIIDQYKGFEKLYWVQEEPSNMGAWDFIRPLLRKILPKGQEIHYVGRKRSASPATGSFAMHKKEHEIIMSALFGKNWAKKEGET